MLARAVGWIDVANRSLSRLRVGLINDLDEGTTNARLCKTHLEEAVNSVLTTGYQFRATVKRLELAALTTAPIFGYDYQYLLPPDFLVFAKDENQDTLVYVDGEYVIESTSQGPAILTNSSTCKIVYVASPESPNYLPPYVIAAISLTLAWKLVPALVANENEAALIQAEAMKAVREAIAADSKQAYAPSEAQKREWTWPDELRQF